MGTEYFVFGQYQLARYEPGSCASGKRISKTQVVDRWGAEIIDEVDEYGSAIIHKTVWRDIQYRDEYIQ